MRAVNLLPRDVRGGRSVTAQNLPAVVGGATGFLVVAVLAGGFLSASSKVSAAQGDLKTAQQQLAATPKPPASQSQTQVNPTPSAIAAEQAPRLQALSAVLSQRIAWDRVLREVSLVLPDDIVVESLNLSALTAGGTGSTGFQISGSTYSYDSVARLLSRMSLVPDLTGVQLSSIGGVQPQINFSLTAGVKGVAAPAAPAASATTPPASTGGTTTTTTTTTGTSS